MVSLKSCHGGGALRGGADLADAEWPSLMLVLVAQHGCGVTFTVYQITYRKCRNRLGKLQTLSPSSAFLAESSPRPNDNLEILPKGVSDKCTATVQTSPIIHPQERPWRRICLVMVF